MVVMSFTSNNETYRVGERRSRKRKGESERMDRRKRIGREKGRERDKVESVRERMVGRGGVDKGEILGNLREGERGGERER